MSFVRALLAPIGGLITFNAKLAHLGDALTLGGGVGWQREGSSLFAAKLKTEVSLHETLFRIGTLKERKPVERR